MPWAVAHRGASGHAPENTLAAFRRAVELGAGFIETDLHLTRDARLVAIHDETLQRTTSGRGAVHDHTLEELRELDAGAWFAAEFAGERIPTLDEVLAFGREHDVVFYLELKAHRFSGVEHAVVAALRAVQAEPRSVVLSFEPGVISTVRRLDASVMSGLLLDGLQGDVVEQAVEAGVRQLAPRADLVTPELVARAHGHGLPVVPWTVNRPEDMRALLAAGVDGIMTDYPDRLLALLSGMRTN